MVRGEREPLALAGDETPTGEQHEQQPGNHEEPREEPEARQAVHLRVVVDVRLHGRDERLVVDKPGGHLREDADVLLIVPSKNVEVLPVRPLIAQARTTD